MKCYEPKYLDAKYLVNPTSGYILWYSMVCNRYRLEDLLPHINSIKLHPRWLQNDTFCQPCATTEELLVMSSEGGKEVLTNKYIISRTLKALDLVMQNPCEVMGNTGGSYLCSPFKSDFTSFHTLETPKTLTGISSG